MHELNVNVSNIAVVAHHKSGVYAAMLLIGALCCPEAPLLVDNHWWRAWWSEGCSQRCADRSIFLYVDGLELEKEHQVTGHDPAWLRGCQDAACNQRLPDATCDLRVVHFMRHPVDMLRSGYLYHRICPNVTPRLGTDGVLYRNVIPDGWRGTDLCLQAPGSQPPASPGHISELRRRWGSQLNRHEVAGALGLAPGACAPLCNLLSQAPTQQGVWAEALRSLRAGDGAASLLRAHATLAEGQSACLASPPNGRARARVARLVPVCLHAATPTAAMLHDGTFVATWTNVAAQLGMSEAARVRLLGQLRANYEARKADLTLTLALALALTLTPTLTLTLTLTPTLTLALTLTLTLTLTNYATTRRARPTRRGRMAPTRPSSTRTRARRCASSSRATRRCSDCSTRCHARRRTRPRRFRTTARALRARASG